MRLVATLNDQVKGQILSDYLKKIGIDNNLEIAANTDWGNPDYGTVTSKVWVIDEDQFENAINIAHEYVASPTDPKYQQDEKSLLDYLEPVKEKETLRQIPKKGKRNIPWNREPMGIVTMYFLVICCIIFFLTEISAPFITSPPPGIPYVPLYYSTLKKELLYDYPQAFEIVDKLVKAYGVEKLQNLNDLPPEGKVLLEQYYLTPYWTGFYDKFVEHIKHPDTPWNQTAPMFEKIREGEWWRTFTPALLHSDIFHLLFNMLWLAILGKQLESRVGKFRYIFFIVITGLVTNLAQYLMSGPNFLGFSGILCAMLTFVWIRQKLAAWEGYQLQPSTMGFMMFFLFTMLGIQIASFYSEAYLGASLTPYIANTAHMTGLAMGLLLGSLNYFGWKSR